MKEQVTNEMNISVGDRFIHVSQYDTCDYYILCRLGLNEVILIGFPSANRWRDSVRVLDTQSILPNEIDAIFGTSINEFYRTNHYISAHEALNG